MKRRTFFFGLGAAIATTFGFKPKVVAQEAANPHGLPVVLFDDDGNMVNGNKIFANIPWTDYGSYYEREILGWVSRNTPVDAYNGGAPHINRTVWGEVKLHNSMSGLVLIQEMPNTREILTPARSQSQYHAAQKHPNW